MRKYINSSRNCFYKVITYFFTLSIFLVISCKKIETSPIEVILGDYVGEIAKCSNSSSSIFDENSLMRIKKSSHNDNELEIDFINSPRGAIWTGTVRNDSLLLPYQLVKITNPDYTKGTTAIQGFGIINENAINFKIEEFYTFNGFKHTCTFSAKRK